MLSATCHCGALRIEIPYRPQEVTSCNCSICRRLGTLWAYYDIEAVRVHGHPEHTDTYIQGARTLRVVRCKTCGCTTHWEPLEPASHSMMGVNIRNFDPEAIGNARIRMLDGADTWQSSFREGPI
ncbi:MAG: GFA family protein [Ramlibacter sp.]|nr:GFA family protein [Ramlibacter sp.]